MQRPTITYNYDGMWEFCRAFFAPNVCWPRMVCVISQKFVSVASFRSTQTLQCPHWHPALIKRFQQRRSWCNHLLLLLFMGIILQHATCLAYGNRHKYVLYHPFTVQRLSVAFILLESTHHLFFPIRAVLGEAVSCGVNRNMGNSQLGPMIEFLYIVQIFIPYWFHFEKQFRKLGPCLATSLTIFTVSCQLFQ